MLKKVLGNVLAVVVFLGMVASPTLAASVPALEKSNDGDLGVIGIQSMQLIAYMDTTIADEHNGNVTISALTATDNAIKEVGVKLYLQWYDENNSTWVTVDSSPMYYSYNAWTADATVSFPAQIGETYRAKTYHYAYDGSISESRYNYTNGITLYR